MITKIGFVAGDIWQQLEERGGTTSFKNLCKAINEPRDQILMSLGWLAREGHVLVEEVGVFKGGPKNYEVTLRNRGG